MEIFGFIPLVTFVTVIGYSLLCAATTQSYAQSDKGAQQETIFLNDILVDVLCGVENILLTGNIHIVNQIFPRGEEGFHIVQHINWNNVKGLGVTTGNEYVASSIFGRTSNFDIDSGSVENVVNTIRVLSKGSTESPNILALGIFHVTINANGEITSVIDDFDGVCRG